MKNKIKYVLVIAILMPFPSFANVDCESAAKGLIKEDIKVLTNNPFNIRAENVKMYTESNEKISTTNYTFELFSKSISWTKDDPPEMKISESIDSSTFIGYYKLDQRDKCRVLESSGGGSASYIDNISTPSSLPARF
ncbi:MAG: hypothetical protein HOO06_10180 [Bdellovibrionaceae bacterium]|jgi:hypothetical protein|nr:hypothetical protein [Pseudobdellovibrionaceae bacterium]